MGPLERKILKKNTQKNTSLKEAAAMTRRGKKISANEERIAQAKMQR